MPSRPTALMVTAALTTAGAGCAPEIGHRTGSLVWCGATLYRGAGMRSPSRLHPVTGRRDGQAPRRSILPATASPHPGGRLEIVITGDCATAPVVTVRPVGAARTLVVAHGANGGVAGLTLATFGETITVRAYQGDRLVGELVMPEGAAPVGLLRGHPDARPPRTAVAALTLSRRLPVPVAGALCANRHVSVGAA